MTEGALSQLLPRQVNPRKMSYAGVSIGGAIDAKSLSLLSNAVDSVGQIHANLDFSISDEGKILVTGCICAELGYQCQRCLESISCRMEKVKVSACVVRSEEEAKQLPARLDPWLVSDEDADLYAFVEEELLLILPVVAYHEDQCIDPGAYSTGGEKGEGDNHTQENPFSVLSVLKHSDEPSNK